MTQPSSKARVLLGRITGVHGIRGEVVIRTYTGEPAAITDYGPLRDEKNERTFKIRGVRETDKGLIARVEGVADRTAAEKLKGTDLYVAREMLPEAEEGAFYHADLIGLRALSPEGEEIGTVMSVANFGAGDLLEIRLKGSKSTEFVPFTGSVVPNVDLVQGRLTLITPVMTGEPEPASEGGADGEELEPE